MAYSFPERRGTEANTAKRRTDGLAPLLEQLNPELIVFEDQKWTNN